jgi:23S rRNA (cytosine1962-C5)-methyltransferase
LLKPKRPSRSHEGSILPNPIHNTNSDYGYRLIDFGNGRKLERFAGRILDRPSPAAECVHPANKNAWAAIDFRFESPPEKTWVGQSPLAEWLFRWNSVVLELRLSRFGHVGLFPEQVNNWRWLQSLVTPVRSPVRALNLFGYTGGCTLALAAMGASVVHVDASRPTVAWARSNAGHSGLESHAIRWIVDDVRSFVARELRRNRCYDLIVMDPPAHGHGTSGQAWQLDRDFRAFFADCLELLSPKPLGLLVTGHSPIASLETGPFDARAWERLSGLFAYHQKQRVSLTDDHKRPLDFGYAYRFVNP